jgi:hypothetical protein
MSIVLIDIHIHIGNCYNRMVFCILGKFLQILVLSLLNSVLI